MAKKKTLSKPARVRPEGTKSRMPPFVDGPRSFVFDKLGKVIRWTLPAAPYKGDANLRPAFIGGFETRVQQIQQSREKEGVPVPFEPGSTVQRAFADGYHAAANQDGYHLMAHGLTGSTPEPPAKKGKKA